MQNPYYCYKNIIFPDVLSRRKTRNHMEFSVVGKITLSYTGKELVAAPTELSIPMITFLTITGQKPVVIWAAKSISNWKLRRDSVIGCKVTLRRLAVLHFLNQNIYSQNYLEPLCLVFSNKKKQNKKTLAIGLPLKGNLLLKMNFIELDKITKILGGFSISVGCLKTLF